MIIQNRLNKLEEKVAEVTQPDPIYIFGDAPIPPGVDPERVFRFRFMTSEESAELKKNGRQPGSYEGK